MLTIMLKLVVAVFALCYAIHGLTAGVVKG
jgi:hypothetical protein